MFKVGDWGLNLAEKAKLFVKSLTKVRSKLCCAGIALFEWEKLCGSRDLRSLEIESHISAANENGDRLRKVITINLSTLQFLSIFQNFLKRKVKYINYVGLQILKLKIYSNIPSCLCNLSI